MCWTYAVALCLGLLGSARGCGIGGGAPNIPENERPLEFDIERGGCVGDVCRPEGEAGDDHSGSHERRKRRCFHVDSLLTLADAATQIPMRDAAAGLPVLALDSQSKLTPDNLTSVRLHDLHHERIFVHILTKGGSNVAVTSEHGIYIVSCTDPLLKVPEVAFSAEEVQPGHCLPSVDGAGFLRADPVQEVRFAKGRGVVEVATSSGRVVVDGVVVSTADAGAWATSWEARPPLDPLYPALSISLHSPL